MFVGGKRSSAKFVLWLYMCEGRVEKGEGRFCAYLRSLPEEMTDVPSWSVENRERLRGTVSTAAAVGVPYRMFVPRRDSHVYLIVSPLIVNATIRGP